MRTWTGIGKNTTSESTELNWLRIGRLLTTMTIHMRLNHESEHHESGCFLSHESNVHTTVRSASVRLVCFHTVSIITHVSIVRKERLFGHTVKIGKTACQSTPAYQRSKR